MSMQTRNHEFFGKAILEPISSDDTMVRFTEFKHRKFDLLGYNFSETADYIEVMIYIEGVCRTNTMLTSDYLDYSAGLTPKDILQFMFTGRLKVKGSYNLAIIMNTNVLRVAYDKILSFLIQEEEKYKCYAIAFSDNKEKNLLRDLGL